MYVGCIESDDLVESHGEKALGLILWVVFLEGGEGRRWFVSKRPRRDTNGGSETEVTETEKRQAKEEREKRKHARTSSDSSKASPRATKELKVFLSARFKRSNPPWMEVK